MKCIVDPNEKIKVLNKEQEYNRGAVLEATNSDFGERIRVSLGVNKTKKLIKQLESTIGK